MTPSATPSASLRPPTTASKVLSLTKQIYLNRMGVLLLTAVIIATLVTIWAIRSPEAQRQVLLAISTGLFSSILYAALETGFTALRHEAVIAESIEQAVESALERALSHQLGQQRDYLPSRVYSPSSKPDPTFNSDLSADLEASSRYCFRGVTGRYAVARILARATSFDSVDLMIANPYDRRGMEPRVTHIVSYIEPHLKYKDVQDRLVEEIYETIVAARSAAVKCRRLDVHIVNDPQIDRVEYFDSSLYLTLYSETKDRGATFPKTVRFSKDSTLYRVYGAQLSRSSDTAAFSIRVLPSTTDEELCDFMKKLGKRDCSLTTIQEYESQFKEFSDAFRQIQS